MAGVVACSENSKSYIYAHTLQGLPLYYLYIYTSLYRVTTLTTLGTFRPYDVKRSVVKSVAKCPRVVTTPGLPPLTTRRDGGCSGPRVVIRSCRVGLMGPAVAERYGSAACGRPR